jgi:hypothetical protein
MKKPHIVKKCAMPGIDHLSSRVCPNTSSNCVVMRFLRLSLRLFASLVGCPDRISFVSHRNRFAASAPTTAIIRTPAMILISICVSTLRLPG